MFNWVEHATQMKQREFFLNAEERQLINEALAAQAKGEPFYYEALAALGRRLTEWGERLQEQYDVARQMPLELPPMERARHE
jgi:hypothetical protein